MSGSIIRLAVFLALWAMLALAEWHFPRHSEPPDRRRRWPINVGLGLLDTLCLRLLMPWLAVDAAVWAQQHRFGVLHLMQVPWWLSAAGALAVLDLVIYFQHRLMHQVPVLWRLHRVHHTDVALDVSSGTRFHPLEILLSMALKIAIVLVLGAAPSVVLAFEVILSAFSLFTHANLAIPPNWERRLRRVFVTPDMHRTHHSVDRREHDRNFCFHVSWWDRLFGTYCPAPVFPQDVMPLGLARFRQPREQGFLALLWMPFTQGGR